MMDGCCIAGFGEVVERLMALGCKPSVLWHYEGSNPSLSTSYDINVGSSENSKIKACDRDKSGVYI